MSRASPAICCRSSPRPSGTSRCWSALTALEAWLADNAGLLQAKFSEASRYTPVRLDAYIVNKFMAA
jgi:hypothetical protein